MLQITWASLCIVTATEHLMILIVHFNGASTK